MSVKPLSAKSLVLGYDIGFRELIMHLEYLCGTEHVIGIDTETVGIDPSSEAAAAKPDDARIACWSISTPLYERVFLWAEHLELFKTLLENPKLLKTGHNIYGFDYHMFLNHGIELQGIASDTLRLSRLLYCSKQRNHGLKSLALHWLGIKQPSFDSLFTQLKHETKYHQEGRKRKGEFIPMEFIETKRKVGEFQKVPTTIYSGERSTFGKALEYIDLRLIPTQYPERLQALYDYATLDAYLTRQLHYKLTEALQEQTWKWSL